MSTYGLEKVIALWETEKLTTEQTIGQILLLLQVIEYSRSLVTSIRSRVYVILPHQSGCKGAVQKQLCTLASSEKSPFDRPRVISSGF